MWDLIVSVPGHCLSFYFAVQAAFYGNAVECLTSTRVTRVRFPAGPGPKNISSPATIECHR